MGGGYFRFLDHKMNGWAFLFIDRPFCSTFAGVYGHKMNETALRFIMWPVREIAVLSCQSAKICATVTPVPAAVEAPKTLGMKKVAYPPKLRGALTKT